ncbi:hypothetical protein D3C80_1113960 [compost metagenome]
MDKGGTVQADVDERRLHPWQHANHLALVDIADNATALRALNMHFLKNTVLHHRHA